MNILKPIELLLLGVFNLSYRITENYGISLLIMSVVITVGTYPLYYLADVWKEKELSIQKIMKTDIDKISNVYTGQKKFYLVQTTYRLHNYKSWYAFRTSLGILIQIPFFFAAYNVLSEYEGYTGCSFLFINDLSKPDALFGSINFLPILMTVFNVVSSVIFTKSLRFKDNTQQFVLAIVFLLFLYDSPSALLIYWTSNNFFSIFKSLIKFIKSRERIQIQLSMGGILQSKTAILSGLIFLFFTSWYICDTTSYTKYVELFIFLLNSVVFVYTYFIKKEKLTIKKFCLYGIYGIAILIYLLKLAKAFGSLFPVILLLIGLCCIYINLDYKKQAFFNDKEEIFLTSFVLSVFLLFMPLSIYTGNYQDFTIGWASVLFPCFLITIVACLLFAATKLILFRNSTIQFSCLFFLILCYFMYTFIFSLNYGLLSEFTFQNDACIEDTSIWLYFKDFFIVFLILLLEKYLFQKNVRIVKLSVYAIIAFFSISIISNIVKIGNYEKDETDEVVALEKVDFDVTTFSNNKKNVLFIMSDMMNGNYLEQYLEENPDSYDILEGFVWYRDTLSISGATVNSLPAMYAGYEYDPPSLNEKGTDYISAVTPGIADFWKKIIKNGYSVYINSEWHGLDVSASALKSQGCDVSDYLIQDAEDYNGLFSQKYGIEINDSNETFYLLEILPSFMSVPNTLKKLIYDEGLWNNPELMVNARRIFSMKGLAYIDVLTDIATIKHTDKNSFIYILSSLTHDSYGINKEGILVSSVMEMNDPNLPYYSAKKMMDELVTIVKWLKTNGIYDNTNIILCSDHGNFTKDSYPCVNFQGLTDSQLYDLSRACPVLLTKRTDASGPLFCSGSLMQNADVYYYIKQYVLDDGTEFSDFENDNQRIRYYYACNDNAANFQEQTYTEYTEYKVNGSLFNQSSWVELR